MNNEIKIHKIHVYTYISLFDTAGEQKLIPEAHLQQIEKNRRNIVRFLHIEESLLNQLQAERVMSSDTANNIRHTQGDGQKNTAFLDYIMKLSQANLNRFIDILCDENQPHVAELFRYHQKGIFSPCPQNTVQ